MRWRDILLGAIVTLVVTVIAGLIVFYATREKPPGVPKEKLVYELERPITFRTETTRMAFLTLRTGNVGNATATNVIIAIEFINGAKSLDRQISLSSSPAGTFLEKKRTEQELQLSIASFTPNETITISLLLDGIPEKDAKVGVKSDISVGGQGPLLAEIIQPARTASILEGIVLPIVVIAFGAQLFIVFFLRPRIISLFRRVTPSTQSVNNTAFLYLYKGLLKEAEELLASEIRRFGADAFMLANYGLALGLSGNIDAAMKHLDATEFYTDMPHERAVCSSTEPSCC